MNSNLTYENLLGTCSNFEAYLLAVAKRLDDDLWVKTKSKHTVQAYEQYLIALPNGIHKQEAVESIDNLKQIERQEQINYDHALWHEAKNKNTMQAYEKYLYLLPNAIHKQEAVESINKIQLQQETWEAVFKVVLFIIAAPFRLVFWIIKLLLSSRK